MMLVTFDSLLITSLYCWPEADFRNNGRSIIRSSSLSYSAIILDAVEIENYSSGSGQINRVIRSGLLQSK
jgi:hypothetical protein